MTEVVVSKQINVTAIIAWEKLSSFKGIEEFSPIEKSKTSGTGEGATRICYLPDGAAIHEVLSMVDESSKEFQYKITEGPFPITGYISTVKVTSTGNDSCKVTWGCEFETFPETEKEMIALFNAYYYIILRI